MFVAKRSKIPKQSAYKLSSQGSSMAEPLVALYLIMVQYTQKNYKLCKHSLVHFYPSQ